MRWPLRSGWSLGVLLIVIVAFIWNAASVLVQYIFTDYSFFRPFFLTYLANSLFVVTLPLRSLSQLVRGCSTSHKPCHRVAATEAQGDAGCATGCAGGSADLRVTARAALVVCPLWFLANFRRAAPPHRRRTAALPPPHYRTAAPPHRRTAAPTHLSVPALRLCQAQLCWAPWLAPTDESAARCDDGQAKQLALASLLRAEEAEGQLGGQARPSPLPRVSPTRAHGAS